MISKSDYLDFWGYTEGTPEAEEAWANKVAFEAGKRVIYAPMVFVQKDICYDSPVDGRHITNKFAREDDLRRNNCIEYDPGMKQDADRKQKEQDAALDASIDKYVEKKFETMPSYKKEKLVNELSSGVDVQPVRLTANGG